jgi:Cu(I)/Ag(I) efflux system periplasmic protein CusF
MTRTAALIAAALLIAAPAFADTSHHATTGKGAAASTNGAADALAEGEVKKVDKSAGKVTIKHGPLPALDMPPMTMVFRVKDPAMLEQLKAGDQIRFKAEKLGGNLTVTEYQPAK